MQAINNSFPSVSHAFVCCSETSKRWEVKDGVWMVWWMKYQIFAPILLLQFLNLFWYFLIWRIAFRYVFSEHLSHSSGRSSSAVLQGAGNERRRGERRAFRR